MLSASQFAAGLPQLQTRQALLVLNLQNDFLSEDGKLPVSQPPDFVNRIEGLVPTFRQTGNVIWVRTEFEAERAVNDPDGEGESVITDRELPERSSETEQTSAFSVDGHEFHLAAASRPSPSLMKMLQRVAARNMDTSSTVQPTATVDETFLSSPEDPSAPRCCLPKTKGAEFADVALRLIDETADSTFVKSHYSAFNSTNLIPYLRGNLVTELFICGVLSNVSVYATALDAARHGYSITLVEDCLGYRGEARHDEAIRQMTELMGADSMSSAELIDEITRAGPQGASRGSVGCPMNKAELEKLVEEAASSGGRNAASSTDSAVSLSDGRPDQRLAEAVVTKPEIYLDEQKPTESQGVSSAHGSASALGGAIAETEPQGSGDGFGTLAVQVPTPTSIDGSLVAPEDSAHILAASSSVPASRRSSPSAVAMDKNITRGTQLAGKERVYRAPMREARQCMGPGDSIGEKDSRIIHDLLPAPLRDDVFQRLKNEVRFQVMYHRGGEVPRLVAVEGHVAEDGTIPIYRHPADESPSLMPFSPVVREIKQVVEGVLNHPVNHVLIQYYRDGQDYISEHSDKTLDIARGSSIVNVSLGAQRVMTLRTKKLSSDKNGSVEDAQATVSQGVEQSSKPRKTQRVPLPHNSMFILGEETNRRWLHSVRQDKRPTVEKSEEELAYGCERISLTFRRISTFINPGSRKVWGQGATSEAKDTAGDIVDGGTPEAESMVAAFGCENQEGDFDWDAAYGKGFDALDIMKPKPRLYLSGDSVSDLRVRLHLASAGVDFDIQTPARTAETVPGSGKRNFCDTGVLRFIDNDPDRSETWGVFPTLFYVETYHRGGLGTSHTRAEIVTALNRVDESGQLLRTWQQLREQGPASKRSSVSSPSSPSSSSSSPSRHPESRETEASLRYELGRWERRAAKTAFVAGETYSLADSAFWPVLHDVVSHWAHWDAESYPGLTEYHDRVQSGAEVGRIVRDEGGGAALEA